MCLQLEQAAAAQAVAGLQPRLTLKVVQEAVVAHTFQVG
jgi:hypothetical protein